MARNGKIQDFRKLNTDKHETAPTKKKSKGSVSASKKKEKKVNVFLPFILVSLILIGICIGCMLTPTFNIDEINVQSGINVNKEEILSKMEHVKGVNTLKINSRKLEKSIEEIPYIKEANIERELPNALKVTYEERKPYAIIKYLESFVIMDKFGYVLEIKKENDMQDLAIIYGIDAEEYLPGTILDGVARLKYENVAYLLETSKHVEFEYEISEINYQDTENLIISIKDVDIEVEYGDIVRERLSEKMIYLNEMIKSIEGKKGTILINSEDYNKESIFRERF
ncbi:MAG: FtsQ-type POTRA domain-containing protein [Clostridia bacterium]|nr:FtsQ-type POTRA domain-containing protein [Clostridia bacterium]